MLKRDQAISTILENSVVIYRQVQRLLRQHVKDSGVSVANLHLLYAIRQQQPVHSRQLAEQLGLSPGAIAQVVDQLDKAGMLSRQSDPNDRRIEHLQLSDHGTATINHYDAARSHILSQALSHLTDEELTIYLTIQQKMRRHLQPERDGSDG